MDVWSLDIKSHLLETGPLSKIAAVFIPPAVPACKSSS